MRKVETRVKRDMCEERFFKKKEKERRKKVKMHICNSRLFFFADLMFF